MVDRVQTQRKKRKQRDVPVEAGSKEVGIGDPNEVTREQMLEALVLVTSGVEPKEALSRLTSATASPTTGPGSTSQRTAPKRKGRGRSSKNVASQVPTAVANGSRRHYTPEQKERALELVASGLKQKDVAQSMGVHEKTISTWVSRARQNQGVKGEASSPLAEGAAEANNDGEPKGQQETTSKQAPSSVKPTPSLYAPKDPGQGLADYEKDAILDLKRRHPSYGPAQIRTQLKRFNGWRMSIKAIAKVLRDNGYQLVHRGSRPEGPEPIRFEAPRRNAIWQVDFAEMRIVGEKLHLCVMLDDFSRYVVGHSLTDHSSSEVAIDVLQKAVARHGKPEAVRTDRGGAFLSKDYTAVLEAEVIDHMVGRPYHPQGGGKVESIIGTVRRELWDVEQFDDREHALQRIREFFDEYNERRAHMGIDGLTPADRYFGRGDRVLAAVNALSRNRNGALSHAGKTFEELVHPSAQTPMEVLRLVLVNGKMELRFCGARVELGSIEGV